MVISILLYLTVLAEAAANVTFLLLFWTVPFPFPSVPLIFHSFLFSHT